MSGSEPRAFAAELHAVQASRGAGELYLGFETRFFDGSREQHPRKALHTVILEHISGLGATTAVGRSAWASAAAVRAGITASRSTPT